MEFYDFAYIGNDNPNWLIFFRGVETTNQIINHPFGNGLYRLFMVIWGMVYDCLTHIINWRFSIGTFGPEGTLPFPGCCSSVSNLVVVFLYGFITKQLVHTCHGQDLGVHFNTLLTMIQGDALSVPMPYNVCHTGVRTLTELDRIPHEKRVLLGKKLDHRVRKHGRIWDFSGNPFFQVDGVLYSHCKVSCGSYLALACFFLTSLSFWPAIASRGSGSLSDWEWVKTWVNYLDWGMIINPCVECNIRMMVGWL